MLRSQAPSAGATIAALARAEGVGVETVRFYQRLGLMAEPERPASGARRYGEADRRRLRFIRRAKAAGFTLSQIAELARAREGPTCGETRALAARQLSEIEARMAELAAMEATLRAWIEACDANAEGGPCPPLAALEEG
ncbi:MAG: MerR family DNA-binding protein [Caulobacteraceae bacterium]